MMRCLCHVTSASVARRDLPSTGLGTCTPIEMLRRVETLDEPLGLRRPRRAGYGEGLAAQDLEVVDAQLRGEDLIAQAGL